MPQNFAEVWLSRVIQNLTNTNVAPWLDGIPELDTAVVEMGSGEASEMNVIHIPRTNFNPDVLINNTAYPLAVQTYTDNEVIVALDKYQTRPTSISDDKIIGASYAVIDPATKSHTVAISSKKYKKAIHSIAPNSDSAATPVLVATGAPLLAGGLPTLTYADLVALKDRLDENEVHAEGRRLVLCTRHYNDMLLDRQRFADKFINYVAGQPAPTIAGFEIYQYNGNPLFTSAGEKKPFGSVKTAGDREASVGFWIDGIAKKTGMTKQYFKPAVIDPESQANLLNYRHYFIAMPLENRFIAAIY